MPANNPATRTKLSDFEWERYKNIISHNYPDDEAEAFLRSVGLVFKKEKKDQVEIDLNLREIDNALTRAMRTGQ